MPVSEGGIAVCNCAPHLVERTISSRNRQDSHPPNIRDALLRNLPRYTIFAMAMSSRTLRILPAAMGLIDVIRLDRFPRLPKALVLVRKKPMGYDASRQTAPPRAKAYRFDDDPPPTQDPDSWHAARSLARNGPRFDGIPPNPIHLFLTKILPNVLTASLRPGSMRQSRMCLLFRRMRFRLLILNN